MRILSLLIMCLYLAMVGCATPYQPLGFTGGYSELPLSDNVFKVSFAGNGYTGRNTVADYALLRSAEVSLSKGYRYFIVTDERSYSDHSTFTTPSTTNYYVSGYGGTATTYGGQTFLVTKPSSNNVIICFKDKPEGIAFDAEMIVKAIKNKYGIQ